MGAWAPMRPRAHAPMRFSPFSPFSLFPFFPFSLLHHNLFPILTLSPSLSHKTEDNKRGTRKAQK
jgi:hypothetical protein